MSTARLAALANRESWIRTGASSPTGRAGDAAPKSGEADRVEGLPEQIEDMASAVGRMRAKRHNAAGPVHRMVRRITILLGRPIAAIVIIAVIIGWCALNTMIAKRSGAPPDPPPFQWLELVISAVALVVVFLVLATQQRDEELAQVHQQLSLQLSISAEQKAAKMIELLELLRKDHPSIPDRQDEKASEMARPADPDTLVNAIKQMTT